MSDGGGKKWDPRNLQLVFRSLANINTALNGRARSLVAGATFRLGRYVETAENCPDGGCTYSGWTSKTTVTFYTMGSAAIRQMNIYHEFGHLLDNSRGMVSEFSGALDKLEDPGFVRDDGYLNRDALVQQRYVTGDPNYANVEALQHPDTGAVEQWADIFANYVAGNIDVSDPLGPGAAMFNFVHGALSPHIGAP